MSTSTDNYVLVGGTEYGKTTLLQQIARVGLDVSSDDRPILPVLINFGAIKKGTNRIQALVRAALPEMPDGCQLTHVLSEGLITLLIDDVVFADVERLSVLEDFIKEFGKNRFVLSVPTTRNDRFISSTTVDLPVHFTRVKINPMRRRELRTLVEKWDPQSRLDRDAVLNRLISAMKGMNVPITAVNGTILLSIFETQADFTPINRSVLIENFIDTLLEKQRTHNVEAKTFDFKNRIDYLSAIASHMVDHDCYILTADQLYQATSDYLNRFGLAFGVDAIINDIIDSRILTKRPDGRVSFRYRAFLEFFIASRMQVDAEFRDWVLSADRYLGFVNEISYYSGVVRNDVELLNALGARVETLSAKVFQKAPNLHLLESFQLPKEADGTDDMLDAMEAQIEAPALTKEERDEILEADLPQDIEGRQEVFRPAPKEDATRWYTALVIYSSVLRNSELVPDHIKRGHLAAALREWAFMFMSSLWAVPQIAKTRAIRVNGIMFRVAVPSHFSEGQVARIIYADLPNAISKIVLGTLGTEKLERQLAEPDFGEANEPKFIGFLRNSLLADLRLGDWQSSIKSYMSDVSRNRYLLEALVWKMSDILRLGTLGEGPRKGVQKLLVSAIGDLKGGTREDRRKIIESQTKRLRIQDLMRRISASDDDK